MNGLRATFLRSGNSGVTPFHSICGDAPEIVKKTTSAETSDGVKVNPDAALAMGKGAAIKELMDLPLAELERRCRHNGLSLVGGREMMVARLLSLEEAEKQRVYDLDEDLKISQSHSSSGRFPTGRKEMNVETQSVGMSGWNHYSEDEKQSQVGEAVPTATTLTIPQPELRVLTKKEKIDPVLPNSKWAIDDDESDDEQKRGSKGLRLGYSSSGSEDAGDGPSRADDGELGTESSISVQPESGMNEEQRLQYFSLSLSLVQQITIILNSLGYTSPNITLFIFSL